MIDFARRTLKDKKSYAAGISAYQFLCIQKKAG